MKNISPVLLRYRECARTIWNNYLLIEGKSSFDEVEEFQHICRALFDALVLGRLELTVPIEKIGREPIRAIKIVAGNSAGVPIMINREAGKTHGYWDFSFNHLFPGKYELLFVAFFDWDVRAHIDFKYYMVFIQSFEGHQELVGRFALIEVDHGLALVEDLPGGEGERG